MPSPHYALVRAAAIDVDPETFRKGQTWPYQPGAAVQQLLKQLRYTPAISLEHTVANTQIAKVVVWRSGHDQKFQPISLAGWKTVDEQAYVVLHIWTWQKLTTFKRVVLERYP